MRSVSVRLDDLRTMILNLGFVGENEHTRVLIDCKKMYDQYPNASAALTVQPPDGEAYPAVIERDGDLVIWDIVDSYLTAEGGGEFQLSFTVDEIVAKTYIGRFRVCRSIVPTGDIPDPLDDFLTRAGAALTAIPETIDAALEEAKESGEFDGPQGPEGPAGADGAPGADGVTYTPSVSSEGVISWTNDGNRQNPSPVNIKGPAGPAGADGQQGPAGQDGQDATPDLIAAAYEDLTYPVSAGTLCYNGEVLYRAKQDIPTSESWTAGHWDATTVADELSRQYGAITKNEQINKAIISVFQHVAFADDDGADAYDALYDLIYGTKTLVSISAVYTQSGTVYDTDSLDSLKSDLVVTALYDDTTTGTVTNYTLSGTLSAGVSTVTVSYEGKTTTFTVTVTASAPTLVSISATFDTSAVVYDTDSLDSLKANLTVMATYSDSQTPVEVTTGYTLSGTLTAGTSTITVTYEGKTATFSVLAHDITYVTGYTMSVNTEPIGLNSNSGRAVFLDAYGDYPIIYKATGDDSPYYPMPIPKGATKLLFDCTVYNGRNTVPIIFKYNSQNGLVRQDNNNWGVYNFLDLSSYNDGTYFITVGVNTASGSGDVTIAFSFE